jgi:hypothetical protein
LISWVNGEVIEDIRKLSFPVALRPRLYGDLVLQSLSENLA